MMKSITTIALVLLGTGEVMGELTGDEILRRVDENATPETQIFTAEMTIIHRSGSKRIREVKVWMKGDDYTLVKFLAPADVKGAGLLSAGDDLWLYLPVLKRVRRITGKERGGSFMGTDFTYEDISEPALSGKYSAQLLSTEGYDGRPCYVLRLVPEEPKAASYSELKLWVDKADFYQVKTEYYDAHGALLKIRYIPEVVKMDGFWMAKRVEMEDVKKGSRTVLNFKDIEINPEIPSNVFTTRYLERGVK